MKLLTFSFLSIIPTTIALRLNPITTELTLSIILSTTVFHASFSSAYVLPRSSFSNDTSSEQDQSEDSSSGSKASSNVTSTTPSAPSKPSSTGDSQVGGNGTSASPGILPAGFPPSVSNSGSEVSVNSTSPGTGTETGSENSTSSSLGTLPAGFPPSISTDGSEVSVNSTSSDAGADGGTGTNTNSNKGTGTSTGKGTLPKGFPPPAPTVAGFVARDELGNHPKSAFTGAAKVRKELVEKRRATLKNTRALKGMERNVLRSSYDV